MEAKQNGRLTLKILSEEFKKEVKYLKETVKLLENRLNNSDTKVKMLEEKLAEKPKVSEKPELSENSDEVDIECNVCKDIFRSNRTLKKHKQD